MCLRTGFQAAPVNVFEERLILQLFTMVIFEAEAFRWVLLHQAFAEILACLAEVWCVGNWIVQDSASYLIILNLKREIYVLYVCFLTSENWH